MSMKYPKDLTCPLCEADNKDGKENVEDLGEDDANFCHECKEIFE